MKSTTTFRNGKITVPAAIRARHNIKEGDRLVWIDDGQTICIVPASADPLSKLFGIWSKRTDIEDSLEFARALRRQAEQRNKEQ